MIIINANAFLDAMEFRMSDLIIENGKIIRILPAGSADPFEPEVINLQGAKLYPGFIDLQINGCGGIIYNDAPTAEKISYMQEINSRSGTTTFLPTLVTTTAENIDFAIDEMRKFQDLHGRLSVPGIHIEGPFISPAKSGIHNKANIRRFTDEKLAQFTAAHRQIAMLTLSPEQFTVKQLESLAASGITLSLGHTACSYEQCIPLLGADKCIHNATHLYNAMSITASARTPGASDAVLDSGIYAGIIADLCHVHPALIRNARRCLGNRLYLVTDALASAGAPADFKSFSFCGKTMYVKDEGFCADENGTLGGSSLTMNIGLRNLIESCGFSENDAINMATVIPAQTVGLDDRLGSISEGKEANLTVLDSEYNCRLTVCHGEILYRG